MGMGYFPMVLWSYGLKKGWKNALETQKMLEKCFGDSLHTCMLDRHVLNTAEEEEAAGAPSQGCVTHGVSAWRVPRQRVQLHELR